MPRSLPDYAYTDPTSAGWIHDQMDYDQQNGVCNDALIRDLERQPVQDGHSQPQYHQACGEKADLERTEEREQDRTDNTSTSTTQRLLERVNVKLYLERVVLPLKQAWASRNLQPEKKPKPIKLGEDWVILGHDGAKTSGPPRFLDVVHIPDPALLHDMQLDMEMGRVIPMRRKP